nr:hypothetical protein CFP56_50411 [Quercus suber]
MRDPAQTCQPARFMLEALEIQRKMMEAGDCHRPTKEQHSVRVEIRHIVGSCNIRTERDQKELLFGCKTRRDLACRYKFTINLYTSGMAVQSACLGVIWTVLFDKASSEPKTLLRGTASSIQTIISR